jgi:endo-1,4-beta-xylanase
VIRDTLLMTRREAMLAGVRLAAYSGLAKASSMSMMHAAGSSPLTLKEAGAPLGCQIGIAANKAILQDPAIARFVILNFNLLTASGIKWDAIHPGPDTYDFTEADWNINFAQKNGMRVHGHNLCWNSPANPAWVNAVINKDNARQYLTSHITTVMERYRGRVDSWDVVNEPVVRWSHRSDGLYPGIWLCLGPEYIDVAFRAAAAADPKPLRILNIYNVEQGSPDDELTRIRTLTLLKQLLARGVPIQAVGLESHLDVSQPLGQAPFIEFVKAIHGLGLEVVVTEMDVMENRAVGSSMDWDQAVAKYYGDYMTEVRSAADPRFIIFWSVGDRWYSGKRIQGLTQKNLSPRLSYQAALTALRKNYSS